MRSSLQCLSAWLMTRPPASIDIIERLFTPDETNGLGFVWKRQGIDHITPDTRRLARPNPLTVFRMPLYAFLLAYTYY